MAFVQAIVRAYEARQMSALGALEKAQIPPDLINDANERITALQMEALSDAAMRELDDEALGWFERRLPWGSYGMLARASISAPQLGLALARWCRHHGLIAQDIQLQLSEQAGIATLTLHESRPLESMREFCMVSVLRNIHGFASWLINEPISPLHASFPFPSPRMPMSTRCCSHRAASLLMPSSPVCSLKHAGCRHRWRATRRPSTGCCSAPCRSRCAPTSARRLWCSACAICWPPAGGAADG
jgi:hypothetical protein